MIMANGNGISHDFQNHCIYFILLLRKDLKSDKHKEIIRNNMQKPLPTIRATLSHKSRDKSKCTMHRQKATFEQIFRISKPEIIIMIFPALN